jgi:hypothetical protein
VVIAAQTEAEGRHVLNERRRTWDVGRTYVGSWRHTSKTRTREQYLCNSVGFGCHGWLSTHIRSSDWSMACCYPVPPSPPSRVINQMRHRNK